MTPLEKFTAVLCSSIGQVRLRLADRDIVPDIEFATGNAQSATVVDWHITAHDSCTLRLSHALIEKNRIDFVALRLGGFWPLLEAYYQAGAPVLGRANINLDDHTVARGLSPCGRDDRSFLVPDPSFLKTRAYAATRELLADGGPPWSQRKPWAVWRGATTGIGKGVWRNLPRVQLCQISRQHPDLLDAAITNVVQHPPAAETEIRQAGLMGSHIATHAFAQWRYQIDIDGNTNAWAGLFQKLLTGSTVIKVASPLGWRQWYYDRLRPWVNYVPVEADQSDLIEKIDWLGTHDEQAQAMGRAGRDLALSLTLESQLQAAMPVMAAAIEDAASS